MAHTLHKNTLKFATYDYVIENAPRKGGAIAIAIDNSDSLSHGFKMNVNEVAIEHLAAQLGAGQHTGVKCPACGDKSPDRALSILVDPPSIKAVCHRASCGFKYSNYQARWESIGAVVRPDRVRPYTGELRSLDESDYVWFMERFHLPRKAIGDVRKSDTRYFLPIVAPEGTRRGWGSRRPWEGSPLWVRGDPSPKFLVYMDNDEPVQSWNGESYRKTRVIVEDQISALRVTWDTGLPSVSIIGTGVNEEKVAELQRHTKHLLIALDADATGQSFSIARKWGQAFESCRVIILTRDIKDTDVQSVVEIFS